MTWGNISTTLYSAVSRFQTDYQVRKKISRNNDDRVVEKSCWQRVGCGKGHPAIYCAAVYILHLKKEEIYQ